jgi:hypothetical protein
MAGPAQSLDLGLFWGLLGRMLARLLTEHAHAEIVIAVQDGVVRLVRVNRSYLPTKLPEV